MGGVQCNAMKRLLLKLGFGLAFLFFSFCPNPNKLCTCVFGFQIRGDGYNVDKALNNVKTQVYKNRNRIREFFRDYDPLRHRLIIDEQFAAALDNSKLIISKQEMKAIIDNYRMNDDPMRRTCWTAFCDEIDTVYTLKELEKTPLRNVGFQIQSFGQ